MWCNLKFEGVLFRNDSRHNDRVSCVLNPALLPTMVQATYLIALCWNKANDTTVLFINSLGFINNTASMWLLVREINVYMIRSGLLNIYAI